MKVKKKSERFRGACWFCHRERNVLRRGSSIGNGADRRGKSKIVSFSFPQCPKHKYVHYHVTRRIFPILLILKISSFTLRRLFSFKILHFLFTKLLYFLHNGLILFDIYTSAECQGSDPNPCLVCLSSCWRRTSVGRFFGQRLSVRCCLSTGDFLRGPSPRLLPPYRGLDLLPDAWGTPNNRNADGAEGIFGIVGRVWASALRPDPP